AATPRAFRVCLALGARPADRSRESVEGSRCVAQVMEVKAAKSTAAVGSRVARRGSQVRTAAALHANARAHAAPAALARARERHPAESPAHPAVAARGATGADAS